MTCSLFNELSVNLFASCADGVPVSDDVQTVSNVRQDLTEWQQKHASLVLDSVKVNCVCCYCQLFLSYQKFHVFSRCVRRIGEFNSLFSYCSFILLFQEISKLRYELCPRHMKDRRFWRIYFTLVSTHVAP